MPHEAEVISSNLHLFSCLDMSKKKKSLSGTIFIFSSSVW